jgi:curved DNA-binding protein CbpA
MEADEMNHYETLGVARDATSEDIRRAARRASSAAHPDREGGSHEKMQAVNVARDVLLDPERRARYDATGQDQPTSGIEEAAREVLVEAFRQALENLDPSQDIVDHVRGMLRDVLGDVAQRKKKAERTRAKLVKQRDRVRVKAGADNLVHGLIDHQVQQCNAQVDGLTKSGESAEAALKMLQAYEFVPDPDAPARPPQGDRFDEIMRSAMMNSGMSGRPFRRY